MIRYPRFRLATLLAIFVPAAMACLLGVRWYESRPIQWQPYSTSLFESRCQDGNPAIVFFSADWDVHSKIVETHTFADRRVTTLLHRNSVTPIMVDCTTQTPIVTEAYGLHGVNTTPYVFIYFPDALDSPTLLPGLLMPNDLIAAIDRVSHSRRPKTGG